MCSVSANLACASASLNWELNTKTNPFPSTACHDGCLKHCHLLVPRQQTEVNAASSSPCHILLVPPDCGGHINLPNPVKTYSSSGNHENVLNAKFLCCSQWWSWELQHHLRKQVVFALGKVTITLQIGFSVEHQTLCSRYITSEAFKGKVRILARK